MTAIRTIIPTAARRLAITRQRLAGARPAPDSTGMMDVLRDIRSLQLDPINVVARSHLLVLFSRLGPYDRAHLDTLLYTERQLFEYWAHAASIVLTEDYPIHNLLMRNYAKSDSAWHTRIRTWMKQNEVLQRYILKELRRNGPLPSRYFEERGIPSVDWVSTGWTGGRNVSRMLDFLWISGKIMVAGRQGLQKLWDVSERVLPAWTPRERLNEREVVRRAAQISLRALGVGRARHIEGHFISGRYPNLQSALDELEGEGQIERVQIADDGARRFGVWYVHADDLPLLERLMRAEFEPRTALLSPFDNLIINRTRTEELFDYKFRIEIYTPKLKRQYGYYVLSILHGERLIGRIDPSLDRAHARLIIHAVHAEPDAPMTRKVARAVAGAIEELGTFLGAKEIVYPQQFPQAGRASCANGLSSPSVGARQIL